MNAPLAADFGLQKIRIVVQEKSGAYPAGAPTSGSTVSIVETDPSGDVVTTSTCTTAATVNPGVSACPSDFIAETPGDTVTVTQTGAAANLVVDPTPQTVGPCALFVPFDECAEQTVTFTDDGLPPAAVDDSATTPFGKPDDIDVLANDSTHGAPATISAVTRPHDGTATIEPTTAPAAQGVTPAAAASAQTVLYTPAAGFVGTDTFTYTLSTANGTSTATVRVTVDPPPPTAKNDTAATTSGKAITVEVTGNDSANGAKSLTITAVSDPAHGTARIEGPSVVYTPARGFVGTDRLSYTVSNGFGTATATITITVTAPPAAPAAPADNSNNSLAATGVDSGELLGLAAGLLVLGAGAAAGGRRTRTRHAG